MQSSPFAVTVAVTATTRHPAHQRIFPMAPPQFFFFSFVILNSSLFCLARQSVPYDVWICSVSRGSIPRGNKNKVHVPGVMFE